MALYAVIFKTFSVAGLGKFKHCCSGPRLAVTSSAPIALRHRTWRTRLRREFLRHRRGVKK